MIFQRRKGSDPGDCLTRSRLLEYVDGVYPAGGTEDRAIRAHVERCPVCKDFADEVRRDAEIRNLSISMAWKQERISCPHRDILAAYHHGSLPAEQDSYLRFHIERIGFFVLVGHASQP